MKKKKTKWQPKRHDSSIVIVWIGCKMGYPVVSGWGLLASCLCGNRIYIYLGRKTGVRVIQAAGDAVLFGDRFHLLNQTDDRLVFLVGLSKSGFELFMGIEQALNFFHRVNDEHVHQILACSIQPVVERLIVMQSIFKRGLGNLKLKTFEFYRGPLGKFQMKLINLFKHSFGLLQSLTARLGQRS